MCFGLLCFVSIQYIVINQFIMKRKLLTLFSISLTVLSFNSVFAQGCFPDPQYTGSTSGIYPAGPMLTDCSGINAYKSYVTTADTLAEFAPLTDSVLYHFDAMRIVADTGLPAGLTLTTDVIGSATQESPYGTWLNSGTAPNLSSVVGCIGVTGDSAAWQAASTGGPNSNGVYTIALSIDYRIASSEPDLTFLVPNGTWASELTASGILTLFVDSIVLDVNGSNCDGSLYVFPEVLADNSSTTECDGSVSVEVYNGVPPYSYVFSNSVSGTSAQDSLCPGLYSVSVEDANGATALVEFVVGSSENVYSNVGSGGVWPPVNTDSLFTSYNSCDLDYTLPLDSFEITNAITAGEDTCIVTWLAWQQGEPFTITTYYPFLGPEPTVFSLILWCENGRAEMGSFQIYEFLDLSAGVGIVEAEIEFSLSPNPTNGEFIVTLPEPEDGLFEIFDVNGSLILSRRLQSKTTSIDLSGYSSGVYLLKVHNSDGVGHRRLIKQ